MLCLLSFKENYARMQTAAINLESRNSEQSVLKTNGTPHFLPENVKFGAVESHYFKDQCFIAKV